MGRAPATPDVVAFVGRVVSDDWQSAVSDELASALNDKLWRTLRSRSGSRSLCHNLAYIARELSKIEVLPMIFAKRVVRRAVLSQGRSTLEARVAEELVDHAVGGAIKLSMPHLEETVRALRVVGIWLCLQGDLSLTGCECLKDLASGKTKELIKAELEAKIDGYVGV